MAEYIYSDIPDDLDYTLTYDFPLSKEGKKDEACKDLEDAKGRTTTYKALYYSKNLKMFIDKVLPTLAPQKHADFQYHYRNYSSGVIERVEKHFSAVFRAEGGVERIDFYNAKRSERTFDNRMFDLEIEYKEDIQSKVFYNQPIKKYFEENFLRFLISSPSSLFMTYRVPEDKEIIKEAHIELLDSETEINGEYIDIEQVVSIKLIDKLVKSVIIQKSEDTRWIVNNSSVHVFKIKGEYKDNGMGQESHEYHYVTSFEHGLTMTPVIFVSCDLVDDKNKVSRRSPITTSVHELIAFNLTGTFFDLAKGLGVLPIIIAPEIDSANGAQSRRHNINQRTGQGNALGSDLPKVADYSEIEKMKGYKQEALRQLSQSEEANRFRRGAIWKLPQELLAQPDMKQNIGDLIKFIYGDVDMLKFQSEDLGEIEKHILNNIIGLGTPYQMSGVRKTEKEIEASVSDLRVRALEIKRIVETALMQINVQCCKLFEPEYFDKYYIDLGNELFLTSRSEILSEVETLSKNITSDAIKASKLKELYKASVPAGEYSTTEFVIKQTIQPYSTKTPAEVELMLATQNGSYFRDNYVYLNFTSIVNKFLDKTQVQSLTDLVEIHGLGKLVEMFNEYANELYTEFLGNESEDYESETEDYESESESEQEEETNE